MKLVGSKTSPYVRKVRVLLAEKAIDFEFIEESAWNANTTVPRYNPLNKVPALVMDDGDAIYDSAVICEYLDAVSGGGLVPTQPAERARVRGGATRLADHAPAETFVAAVEHRRLPGRHRPLGGGELELESLVTVQAQVAGRVRLPIACLGGQRARRRSGTRDPARIGGREHAA